MNIDKLMKDISAIEPGRYDCKFSDIIAIRDAVGGEGLDFGAACFRFGFIQGQQAERAAARKKAREKTRREAGKSAPGYGFLMAMAKKNMCNERFVSIVSILALKMDGCTQKTTERGR